MFFKEKRNEAPETQEAKITLDDIFYALSLIMDKMDIKLENESEKEEIKEEEKVEDIQENESVDKRKLIDEVGGILNGKVDDETIELIIKKIKEEGYNESEDDEKVNACKNSIEEEQRETGEEELKKDLEKEDKKDEKENSLKSKPILNAIKNSIKENSLCNFETSRERIQKANKKYSI